MRTFTQVHKEVMDSYSTARGLSSNGFVAETCLELTQLAARIYSEECQVEISINNARGRNERLRPPR